VSPADETRSILDPRRVPSSDRAARGVAESARPQFAQKPRCAANILAAVQGEDGLVKVAEVHFLRRAVPRPPAAKCASKRRNPSAPRRRHAAACDGRCLKVRSKRGIDERPASKLSLRRSRTSFFRPLARRALNYTSAVFEKRRTNSLEAAQRNKLRNHGGLFTRSRESSRIQGSGHRMRLGRETRITSRPPARLMKSGTDVILVLGDRWRREINRRQSPGGQGLCCYLKDHQPEVIGKYERSSRSA